MGGQSRSAPPGGVVADTDATDSVLLLRARSGDLDAVVALWRRHLPGVEVTARQLVTEDRDAEELAADTVTNMLALLLRGSGPASSVQRYLRAATYHNAAARHRRSSREVPVADSATFEVERADLYPDARQAELDVLRRAFDGLPLRWRTVLLRTAVDHETAATVGAELGLTANAVSALSRRARRALVYAYMSAHFPQALEPPCQRFVRDLAAVVTRRPTAEVRSMVHLLVCPDCARRTEACRQLMRPGSRFPGPVS